MMICGQTLAQCVLILHFETSYRMKYVHFSSLINRSSFPSHMSEETVRVLFNILLFLFFLYFKLLFPLCDTCLNISTVKKVKKSQMRGKSDLIFH